MDDKERRSAFTSALTTEHYVLQAAAGATITEAGARASLYAYSLSSALVAIGFASQSRDLFRPIAGGILLLVFVLGVLTILRLVESSIDNQKALRAIARIRGYYRIALWLGAATSVVLMIAFVIYQKRRHQSAVKGV